jgi:SAM-dependent methyltransferase
VRQNDYREFFNTLSGEEYLDQVFTKNTINEVDFLLDVLSVQPGQHILDVGCGPGRHAIELARRGYRVTGVDFSESFLAAGAERAEQAGVGVEFVCQDAREFARIRGFDAAICICEGAFGLLERDEDNQRILRNIADSLKAGGRFVLTTLNGYWVIRQAPPENTSDNWFDLIHCTNNDPHQVGGKMLTGIERAYIVPELLKMHAEVGLEVLHVYGGTAGNWGRRELEIDEIEVMLISGKARPSLSRAQKE